VRIYVILCVVCMLICCMCCMYVTGIWFYINGSEMVATNYSDTSTVIIIVTVIIVIISVILSIIW